MHKTAKQAHARSFAQFARSIVEAFALLLVIGNTGAHCADLPVPDDKQELRAPLRAKSDAASRQFEKKDWGKAFTIANQLSKECQDALGEFDAQTINAYAQLALMAENYNAIDDAVRADRYILRALKHIHATQATKADHALHLALMYQLQGQYADAEKLLKPARTAFEKSTEPFIHRYVRLLKTQTQVYSAQRKWDEAEESADANMRMWSRLYQNNFYGLSWDQLSTDNDISDKSISFSLAVQRCSVPSSAVRFAEWALNIKAVSAEKLAARLRASLHADDPVQQRLMQRWLDSRSEVAELGWQNLGLRNGQFEKLVFDHKVSNLRSTSHAIANLERINDTARSVPAAQSLPLQWMTIDELRKTLPADSVFIDFVVYRWFDCTEPNVVMGWKDNRVAAFIVPANPALDVVCVDLGVYPPVYGEIAAFRQAIQFGDLIASADSATIWKEPLQAVSDRMLKPLLRYIGAFDRWIISPDCDLWDIPWAALLEKDDKHVVESHALSIVNSGRELFVERTNHVCGPPVIFGDPDYGPDNGHTGGRGFLKLPGTEKEVAVVTPLMAKLYGVKPTVHSGDQATEEKVRGLVQPAAVLFSTHGYSNITPPALSGVVDPLISCGVALAGANRVFDPAAKTRSLDGILTGYEVIGCDYRGTDLVVLSACQTATGGKILGQGEYGLQEAFRMAGATSVIGSQWSVPDAETAEHMQVLFRELAAGSDKDVALQKAQQHVIGMLREKYGSSPPRVWGAFRLVGDWRRSKTSVSRKALPQPVSFNETADISKVEPVKASPADTKGRKQTERIFYSNSRPSLQNFKWTRVTEKWPNAKPKMISYFKDEQEHGERQEWDQSGRLRKRSQYFNGQLWWVEQWDERGESAGRYQPATKTILPRGLQELDLMLGNPRGWHVTLEMFLPETITDPLPVVIVVSGEDFEWQTSGSIGELKEWAKEGLAVVHFQPRRMNLARFPSQLADCKEMVRRIQKFADDGFPLNPKRIGVFGCGSSGHLALLTALTGDSEDDSLLDGAKRDVPETVHAVCAVCPPINLLELPQSKRRLPPKDPLSAESTMLGGPLLENEARAWKANPITYVSAPDPPTLIILGSEDEMVPVEQVEDLLSKLRDVGVEATLTKVPGESLSTENRTGDQSIYNRAKAFFKRQLMETDAGRAGKP